MALKFAQEKFKGARPYVYLSLPTVEVLGDSLKQFANELVLAVVSGNIIFMGTKEINALEKLIGKDAVRAMGIADEYSCKQGVRLELLPELLDKTQAISDIIQSSQSAAKAA